MTTDARNEYDAVRARLRELVDEVGLSRAEHKLFDEALVDLDVAVGDLTTPAKPARQVWYMAHPVRGDVAANVARAKRWLRFLRARFPDVAIIAPWITAIDAGEDDSDPAQRERGLLDCEATVERCDAIVLVGGRVSSGMQREAVVAKLVHDWTGLGDEPPVNGRLYTWDDAARAIADKLSPGSRVVEVPGPGGRLPRPEVVEFVHVMAERAGEVARDRAVPDPERALVDPERATQLTKEPA